eukprot:SAG31_NODE_688_length_12807_cov_6.395814_10_plen_104_part_00
MLWVRPVAKATHMSEVAVLAVGYTGYMLGNAVSYAPYLSILPEVVPAAQQGLASGLISFSTLLGAHPTKFVDMTQSFIPQSFLKFCEHDRACGSCWHRICLRC